ncbi:hypothetical protein GCM10010095_57410 [Streptomyces anthocyanicus]|nr:hypothetical protein GCM10010095_57410 [Streptomyces anthocyanicus]
MVRTLPRADYHRPVSSIAENDTSVEAGVRNALGKLSLLLGPSARVPLRTLAQQAAQAKDRLRGRSHLRRFREGVKRRSSSCSNRPTNAPPKTTTPTPTSQD